MSSCRNNTALNHLEMDFHTTDYSLGECKDELDVASEIRQRIIYMQREGWGRHWGKETERECASDGKRDAVAREQHPQRTTENRSETAPHFY